MFFKLQAHYPKSAHLVHVLGTTVMVMVCTFIVACQAADPTTTTTQPNLHATPLNDAKASATELDQQSHDPANQQSTPTIIQQFDLIQRASLTHDQLVAAASSIAKQIEIVAQEPTGESDSQLVQMFIETVLLPHPSIMCRILEQCYLDGRIQTLQKLHHALGDTLVADSNVYHVRRTLARAWTAQFWRQADGKWLAERDAQAFRELASQTTLAYERALEVAPDDYEQLMLAAQWMNLQAHSQFDSDSAIIRQAFFHTPAWSAAQLQERRRRFLNVLERHPTLHRNHPADLTQPVIDSWMIAADTILKFPIPQHVLDEIAAHLGQLLDHDPHWVSPDGPQVIILKTKLWYLWKAAILDTPSAAEQALVERQVDEFARQLQERINNVVGVRDSPLGQARRQQWTENYQQWRENRFFSYYRRPRSDAAAVVRKTLDVERSLLEMKTRLHDQPAAEAPARLNPLSQEQADARRQAFADAVHHQLMTEYAADDFPGYVCHLPDSAIFQSFGYTRPDGLFAFRAQAWRSWAAYPEAKMLTGNEPAPPHR